MESLDDLILFAGLWPTCSRELSLDFCIYTALRYGYRLHAILVSDKRRKGMTSYLRGINISWTQVVGDKEADSFDLMPTLLLSCKAGVPCCGWKTVQTFRTDYSRVISSPPSKLMTYDHGSSTVPAR